MGRDGAHPECIRIKTHQRGATALGRRSGIIPPLLSSRKNTAPWKQNASTPSATRLPISPLAAPNCGGIFDFDVKAEKLEELNQEMADPKIWEDAERAQALGKEKKSLENVVADA